jgi:hypothetical protein
VGCHDDDALTGRSGTSVRRHHPSLFPVLLIAFGASVFLHNMVGHGVSVFPLAIGLFLIARSGGGDHYPLFVIGVVLAGSGLGNLVGDLFGGRDAFGSLGTAGGFFYLATADPKHRSRWALVPAAILALIGIGQLGAHVSALFNGSPGWIVPAGVVVAGVLLLGAHRLPGPVRLAGLVFVGAAVLSLLSHTNNDRTRVHGGEKVLPTVPASFVSLPEDIAGKTLWIETGNGAIVVERGDRPKATVGGGGTAIIDGDRITLEAARDNASWHIEVPAASKLHLRTENGSITVSDVVADLDAQTDNGALVVTVADDQLIAASSDNGSVSSGDLQGVVTRHSFVHVGTNGRVKLQTGNGAIVIRKGESAAPPVGAGRR